MVGRGRPGGQIDHARAVLLGVFMPHRHVNDVAIAVGMQSKGRAVEDPPPLRQGNLTEDLLELQAQPLRQVVHLGKLDVIRVVVGPLALLPQELLERVVE